MLSVTQAPANMARTQIITAVFPLIVWLGVDALWGSLAGLIAGATSVLLLAIREFHLHRRFERGLLLDLLLMLVLGLPEIPGALPLPGELMSPLVELLCAALLLPVFFNKLPRTATAGLHIPEGMQPLLVRWMRATAILLFLHALLLLGAWSTKLEHTSLIPQTIPGQAPGPKETWHNVFETASGPLFWILPGLLAVGWVVRTRHRLRSPGPDDPNEWLAVVDTNGHQIARAKRGLLHSRADLLQHVVHLVVRHPHDGRILLQKRRTDRAAAPGLWDTAAAGHVRADETPQAALIRETREELGIPLTGKEQWVGSYILQDSTESEYTDLWLLETPGPFHPDTSEMEDLAWHTEHQIEHLARSGKVTQGAIKDIAIASRQT